MPGTAPGGGAGATEVSGCRCGVAVPDCMCGVSDWGSGAWWCAGDATAAATIMRGVARARGEWMAEEGLDDICNSGGLGAGTTCTLLPLSQAPSTTPGGSDAAATAAADESAAA